MLVVFTIGHPTRRWEAFLDLLRAHGIKRVVDVGSIPRSRNNPQFNRRDAVYEAAVREDWLRAFAQAGRSAPRTT